MHIAKSRAGCSTKGLSSLLTIGHRLCSILPLSASLTWQHDSSKPLRERESLLARQKRQSMWRSHLSDIPSCCSILLFIRKPPYHSHWEGITTQGCAHEEMGIIRLHPRVYLTHQVFSTLQQFFSLHWFSGSWPFWKVSVRHFVYFSQYKFLCWFLMIRLEIRIKLDTCLSQMENKKTNMIYYLEIQTHRER